MADNRDGTSFDEPIGSQASPAFFQARTSTSLPSNTRGFHTNNKRALFTACDTLLREVVHAV